MDEYTHHLDSKISRLESLFPVHFGAPPVSVTKEIDKTGKKSLYYRNLSDGQKGKAIGVKHISKYLNT
jgi:hypothetical protein